MTSGSLKYTLYSFKEIELAIFHLVQCRYQEETLTSREICEGSKYYVLTISRVITLGLRYISYLRNMTEF